MSEEQNDVNNDHVEEESAVGSRQSGDDLSKIKAERDEYLEGWRRAKADYENLVRETERKRTEFGDWAVERVLAQLVPALDQYEVALRFTPKLDAIPADQRRPFENWIVGLEAVRSLWQDATKDLGLEAVRTTGVFDPALHEAVGEEASETIPPGDIIRATMNGYTLKGRLIRPAKVVVSKTI